MNLRLAFAFFGVLFLMVGCRPLPSVAEAPAPCDVRVVVVDHHLVCQDDATPAEPHIPRAPALAADDVFLPTRAAARLNPAFSFTNDLAAGRSLRPEPPPPKQLA